jgi:DNA mismatch repair ATPase MutS
MQRPELLSFYRNKITVFSETLKEVTGKINLISNFRLAIALLFVVAIYFALVHNPVVFYLHPILVVVFVYLVSVHASLFREREHLQNLIKLNQGEVQSLQGDSLFFKTGEEFIDPHHAYTHDLDIFGSGSLFQFLNRCNTLIGQEEFATRLEGPLGSKETIVQNQQAIEDLKSKTDFRQHFQAAGIEISELPGDRDQLLRWAKTSSFIYGKRVHQIILTVVPLLTLALIIGWIFSNTFRPFAILMLGFQWAFLGFHIKKINAFHEQIGRKKNIVQKYGALLSYLEKEKFSSNLMTSLADRAKDAGKKVSTLGSLVNAFDARANSLATLLVNSTLMYDFQCVYRLEKWKEENASQLETWMDVVSETEVLCSFGTFAFNNERFKYATIQDTFAINAKSLGHPLINEGECVANDFQIGDGPTVLIITGANMAGKSTFLRTLGVNLVLALNGAPVCAEEFRCPILQLRTGMRTADSLKDHQSYFYAELNRLKGIMDELRSDVPLLILLDEILKGTNSTDKQAGSISLVKQLLPHPCLAIIATHDLALGALEHEYPGKIKNYCFEANIENDQLSFDYKLKTGLAQKMNATFLMKKMGIIP